MEWRQLQFKVDNLRADYGKVNKEVAAKKKAKEDADDLIAKAKGIDADIKVTACSLSSALYPLLRSGPWMVSACVRASSDGMSLSGPFPALCVCRALLCAHFAGSGGGVPGGGREAR